jgi:SAM-dependent methyltransferase
MTTPAVPQVTPERILQFAWGYVPPLVLEAAIHHRVFDLLDSGGPQKVSDIQRQTGASERGLTAIMNTLVALNFLAKDSDGRYSLTPESSAFLVSTKPAFQGGLIRHLSQQLMPKFLHLNKVVETGRPVENVDDQVTGVGFFQELVTDIFPMSYPAAQALARHLNLGAAGKLFRVLDIAAGSGVWGIALAQSSDQVRVTDVDWREVLPVTRRTVERFGLGDRFSYVGGDLADAAFGHDYDLAILGHILHSQGRERGRAIVAKVFQALAPGGTIVIAEFLVNNERTGPVGSLLFAVNMLVNTDKGDTFSFEEISSWLRDAGFTNIRQLDAPGPSPLILATKL